MAAPDLSEFDLSACLVKRPAVIQLLSLERNARGRLYVNVDGWTRWETPDWIDRQTAAGTRLEVAKGLTP